MDSVPSQFFLSWWTIYPFLTVLKLKGILKILHSQRWKAAVNLSKSALLELFEVVSADNLPTKSLACLECLWASELSNAANFINILIFHLGLTSASLALIQFFSDQFDSRWERMYSDPTDPKWFQMLYAVYFRESFLCAYIEASGKKTSELKLQLQLNVFFWAQLTGDL